MTAESVARWWLAKHGAHAPGPVRAPNPLPLLALTAGFGTGVLCGASLVFFRLGGAKLDHGEYVELEDIEGAVLLFGDDGSLVDKVIDAATGTTGICHAGLWVGLTDREGEPLFVEAWAKDGVRLVRPDHHEGREVVVIPLSAEETAYARQAALRHLHARTPYRGRRGGMTCSEFVVACLPPRLRARFDRGLVTPAELASELMKDHDVTELKTKLLR